MTVTRILIVTFWLRTAGFHQVTVVTYKDYLYLHRGCWWLVYHKPLSYEVGFANILGVEIKNAKWEGRCVNRLLKEHDRDMWLSWAQTSTVSEHANKTRHYLL